MLRKKINHPAEQGQSSGEHRKSNRSLRLGAVLVSALAVAAGLPPKRGAASSKSTDLSYIQEAPRSAEQASDLIPLEQTPAYGQEVTPQQVDSLKNSTFKLLENDLAPTELLSSDETCTATKISSELAITAAHCLSFLTRSERGMLHGQPNWPKAADLYQLTQNYPYSSPDYPLKKVVFDSLDARLPVYYHGNPVRENAPDATVKGISVSFDDIDIALLKLNPIKPHAISEHSHHKLAKVFNARPWSKVESLPYLPAIEAPPVGQEAVIYSIPQYSKENPENEKGIIGRYVGRIKVSNMTKDGTPVELDVVATGPQNQGEQTCYPGASGSAALLADGHVLAPLASAINIGYGPDHKNIDLTTKSLDIGMSWWNFVETSTGVSIPQVTADNPLGFNTLCFYSVPNADTFASLNSGLGKNIGLGPLESSSNSSQDTNP